MSRKLTKLLKFKKERAKFTHFYQHSPISEQFRTMRTNLSFSGLGKDIRTLLVTSPGEGEGKTTTVVNLAIVLAQQGKRVLLIDGDLRKPAIHQIFDIDDPKGLTDVFLGTDLSLAISNSGIHNLDLLLCGQNSHNPSELLSSEKLRNIVTEVEQEYDIVLFDTPPILHVSDTQLIANFCQGAILVLKSGETTTEDAQKAKELLSITNARLLGASLNGNKVKRKAYSHY